MIPEPQATDARWGIAQLLARRPEVYLAARYYDGDHRLAFASDRFRNAFGRLFQEFALNLCAPVIDTMTARLQIVGFAADQEDIAAAGRELWDDEELALVAGEVHREALVARHAAVVIWPNPETLLPVFYPQRADEIAVRGDQERGPNHVRYAVKWWRDEDHGRARLTLYYADRIERYATPVGQLRPEAPLPEKVGDYVPLADDDPAGVAIVPHAWGVVPVVEFTAPRSELRDVVPVNDALNKSVLDALVGGEFMAFPQRVATGVERPVDENGNPIPFRAAADEIWATEREGASWGSLPAGDVAKLITVKDSFIADVVRVSGVPAHAFQVTPGGQHPSGEALRVAESRLVDKVGGYQALWRRRWGLVMSIGLRMAARTGADQRIAALWRSAESRSAREDAETALMRRRVGVSIRQALSELGYSDEQIALMREEEREDQARLIDSGALV